MRICTIKGCKKPYTARGWCNTHYMRWYHRGDSKVETHRHVSGPEDGRCSINGCNRKHKARGLCRKHYKNWDLNTNIQTRLAHNLRFRVYAALNKKNKSISTLSSMGCSLKELMSYLERLFVGGMSWDNYGTGGWHVDHVKPLSLFDLDDKKQYLEAFHYTNLQPLWAHDNLSKGNKYEVADES